MTTDEIVAGVLNLFPGADRQALRCLADLMAKDHAAAYQTLTAISDERQRRAEHLHDLVYEAREIVRKRLEPDSPPEDRALYEKLATAVHSLRGDPFDMHFRAALAAYQTLTSPENHPSVPGRGHG